MKEYQEKEWATISELTPGTKKGKKDCN